MTIIVKYPNRNNDQIACLITKLEENKNVNGFIISFRLYNLSEGIGGFETTVWVANAPIEAAKMFVGSMNEIKDAAQIVGAKITSKKINNKVPVNFQFKSISKKLFEAA